MESGQEALGVVVGCDGSEESTQALHWAAAEADARGVPLTLCHVWEWPYHEWPGELVPLELAKRPGRRLLERCMAQVAERHPAVHVHSLLRRGSAADNLTAIGITAELVVVGARGYGGFAGLLVGSVSAQVAAHARCPAVVVRGEGRMQAGLPVVVGVDGSPGSRAALEFAIDEAALHQVPLRVVCAHEESEGAAEKLLDAMLSPLWRRRPGLEISTEPVVGRPRETLLGTAKEAGLVVVGARGLGEIRGLLLGSVSQALVHHAPCPVAVIHATGRGPSTSPTGPFAS